MLADHMFEIEIRKQKQISAMFDAPQFAHDFIEIAKKTKSARDMKIMIKAPKRDKYGDPILRNGVQVMAFSEYSPTPSNAGRSASREHVR